MITDSNMGNFPNLALTAGLLAFLTILLFIISWILTKRSGIPGGRILYSDHGDWSKTQKPFYDAVLGLTGKPDYLIKQGDQIVPVEVKSSRAPNDPYDSHVMQLAAYCLLVERSFHQRPPYGVLRYSDRTFQIPYTEDLELKLLDLIESVRSKKNNEDVPRSHTSLSMCNGCGYRNICDQRL